RPDRDQDDQRERHGDRKKDAEEAVPEGETPVVPADRADEEGEGGQERDRVEEIDEAKRPDDGCRVLFRADDRRRQDADLLGGLRSVEKRDRAEAEADIGKEDREQRKEREKDRP